MQIRLITKKYYSNFNCENGEEDKEGRQGGKTRREDKEGREVRGKGKGKKEKEKRKKPEISILGRLAK